MNQPNHITISPAKLEKRNEQVGSAGNLWELLTTGATTFALAPALLKHVADFAVRVDWQQVFVVTARLLVSIGLLITAYQYFQYTLFFGAGALAFIGQFLIGVFFAAVVFYTRDGLQIITAAAGMYLLISSF